MGVFVRSDGSFCQKCNHTCLSHVVNVSYVQLVQERFGDDFEPCVKLIFYFEQRIFVCFWY